MTSEGSAADPIVPASAHGGHDDGLLDRIALVEAQPLAERAAGFEQLHNELLAELQRSDQGA